MWESILFLHLQRQKKKVDAARFLDARGDEKQVINLERPLGNLYFVYSHSQVIPLITHFT